MREDNSLPLLKQRALFAGDALGGAARAGTRVGGVRSLYIHVPFCFHKCHYCDFYSIVDTQDRQEGFLARLESELRALAPWGRGSALKTIFVGGGTPSLLRVELWERLLTTLHEAFDLSGRNGAVDDFEFTVECNPETVTSELMAVLRRGGVSRVSMGAQSFDRRHLKTLERWHEPENVAKAMDLARSAGIERRSIDLIFGVPGQSLEDWRRDLERAAALGTEHLSCYCLTYEPRTALTARRDRGEVKALDEDLEAEMMQLTLDVLRVHGLERYEISNFARRGAECRHNLAYWRQEEWLAAGPSASAHVAGRRWKNVARLDDYLSMSQGGFAPITDFEEPNTGRALVERVMTGLRLREGIDAAALERDMETWRAGSWEAVDRVARRNEDHGLLVRDEPRWTLTDAGFFVADSVTLEMMEAMDSGA